MVRGRQQEEAEREEEINRYINQLETSGKYPSSVTRSLRMMDLGDFDLNLMLHLIKYICSRMDNGAILVFLPGWDTISKLHDMLNNDVMFRGSSRYIIIPLHSLMPTTTQKQVRAQVNQAFD